MYGPGPLYAVGGTNQADRIIGTHRSERILGLEGESLGGPRTLRGGSATVTDSGVGVPPLLIIPVATAAALPAPGRMGNGWIRPL